MEECNQKKLSLSDKFGMFLLGLNTYFLEISAPAFLKTATKGSFRNEKKLAFLGYFSEAKTEECNQKNKSVCNRFGIIMPCSATYFLEGGAHVSLKVATKVFWR